MQKQCPICRLQVAPSLDGSCPDCGVSLDDAPEVVDIESASVTSCAKCGAFLLGSEDACPSCGVALPARGASRPVGVVPEVKPDGATTLGAPRPQTAEDAQIWAGLPVGWSAEGGDTSPDAIAAPPTKPAAPPSKPTVPPSKPAAPPSKPAAPPAAAAPSAVPSVPAVPKSSVAPELQLDAAGAGSRLALATPKKGQTNDWDRKWQRAELDAKRTRRSSGGGRVVLHVFGFVLVLAVGGAIAAQALGLLAPPAPEAMPTAAAAESPDASTAAEPTPTARILPPPTLPPTVSREQRLARADSLAARGKLADAIREYDALLGFEPELADVHFRQASLYARLKNYGKACVAYRRYLEIEPEGEHAKEANAGAVRCR